MKNTLKIGKGFGKQLRKLRKAAGLSQTALAEKTGVHHVSIAQYETGVHEPSKKSAEKLMGFFKPEAPAFEPPEHPNCKSVIQPVPKRRGRPKKEKAVKSLCRRKREFYKDEVEPAVQKIVCEDVKKHDGAELGKTPVRLGEVSAAWIEQQADSHVHARGWMVIDGPVRVVVLNRTDLILLCRIMLGVAGVRVDGEIA